MSGMEECTLARGKESNTTVEREVIILVIMWIIMWIKLKVGEQYVIVRTYSSDRDKW